MNRRRLVAALFFSAVVVATLVTIVYTERVNAGRTLPVWVLTHDVRAGDPLRVADVQREQVPATESSFNFEERSPDQLNARFVRNMRARDILRSDDLVSGPGLAEVALSLQNSPPLNAGDTIDIFVALPGGRQARIGRDVTVVTVSGTAVDVLVPVADEAAWVTVASSTTALHAARAASNGADDPSPLSTDEAIGILCGASCGAAPPAEASPAP